MKIREFSDSNYKSLFFNGKTIRQKFDYGKPFGMIPYPEIEDVAINNRCLASCSYCYTSATRKGVDFHGILEKAEEVWGSLKDNERPNQIAIGGAGESTMHPQWSGFVKKVKELGIVPNYTTNGMHLTDEILEATEQYCGGVAISFHPHIRKTFEESIGKLKGTRTKLNTHVILGSEESLRDLQWIHEKYSETFDYFVVLPYQASGRGKKMETENTWKGTFEWISSLPEKNQSQFAFGALFYEYMKVNEIPLKMSIYEPEIFSGYRVMDDSYRILRKSSYDLTPKI